MMYKSSYRLGDNHLVSIYLLSASNIAGKSVLAGLRKRNRHFEGIPSQPRLITGDPFSQDNEHLMNKQLETHAMQPLKKIESIGK